MSTWTWDPKDSEGAAFGQGQLEPASGGQQQAEPVLLYSIKGRPAFAYVDLLLQPKQRVVTDANHMLWMDRRIGDPTTTCFNGCWKSWVRTLSKEACCYNTYTNDSDEQAKLTVGFNDPGDILSFSVAPNAGWVLNQGTFIAGTDNIEVSGRCAGCCGCGTAIGNEGVILTHVSISDNSETPTGVFVAGSYGTLVRHDIPPGSCLYVSRGLFFAAHESTKITIGLNGGLKNLCCSGAALVMKFYGPSVVYTQSRDPKKWNPLKNMPPKQKKRKGGGAN